VPRRGDATKPSAQHDNAHDWLLSRRMSTVATVGAALAAEIDPFAPRTMRLEARMPSLSVLKGETRDGMPV